ncbi:hypothetical protein GQR58_029924 [Nymphon striatum]|nr:hypothetical protein GQR58_029924 [Nymphon striatum]
MKRIVLLLGEQREHLGVHDASASGKPLNIALTKAGSSAKRVRRDRTTPVAHRSPSRNHDEGAAGTLARCCRDTCSNHRPRRSPDRSGDREDRRRELRSRRPSGTGPNGAHRTRTGRASATVNRARWSGEQVMPQLQRTRPRQRLE